MKNARVFSVVCAAVAALTVAGCGDSTPTATVAALFNDSTATLDIATSAGDAAATMVQFMKDDDSTSGVTADVVGAGALMSAANPINSLTVGRVRTCYDAAGVVVVNCSPLATVRTIVTRVTADGTRSKSDSTTGGSTATWTGSVHRIANDSATRVFVGTTETSRIHSNTATAHDTTTFTEGTTSRTNAEVAHDSVRAVTYNLPRSSNPFPVSGSIVRVDSVHIAIVKANSSETKDIVRNVEIDFPAVDAQGNVVMKINAKTCNLNLVTHRVTLCH